jgi:DNA-binding MarR family transcriptional regulator
MARDIDVEQAAAALRVSIGLLIRRLRQSPVVSELSLPETGALVRLDRSGPRTSAELARVERISPQSMGVTLGGLEARGLVARSADPQDGRRVILALTEAGRDLLRDKRDARVQQLAQALASEFSSAELEQLLAAAPLIERLAERL